MDPTFSEFSYGFAVTNEFVGQMSLSAAPIFPSLLEEGKEGGGYDVKFDQPALPLFLQFKRSERMVSPMAREYGWLGPIIDLPYHRFWITPSSKSQQHQMLLNLDVPGKQVFYVAPRFHLVEELNDAWIAQSVAARSIFVPPRTIGPMPDSGKHSIAFDRRNAWRCSEPVKVEALNFDQMLARMKGELSKREDSLRDELPAWERELMAAEVRPEVSEDGYQLEAPAEKPFERQAEAPPIHSAKEVDPARLTLQRIADRARIEFDAQFFVIQSEG